MDKKLNFLLDKSTPFDSEKVAFLDTLTKAIQENSPDVRMQVLFRRKKLMRYGGFCEKMIIFGTTQIKFFKCRLYMRQRCSFL